MPIFITQGRYSEHALKGMMANPEDRAKAVAELFQRAGGKLLGFYFTFGEYDWISIADMPDHRSDLAVVIAGASNGAVTDVRTTVAVTTETFMQACADAAKLAATFKPAGGGE
jgi:uncharacterized protein with GYD domain